MNIIIPMAGMGKRLRPHTLTIPKPLISVGGKPIVQRLVEDIVKVCGNEVEKIGFITNPAFGREVEASLINIASKQGAKGYIFHQTEALGTGHAILCASDLLEGKVVVAFADTLFKPDFTLKAADEGIIWVKEIENPEQFGVVKLDPSGGINGFVEKPKDFVSNLAIIGIYYFPDGKNLHKELQFLIDNNIKDKGEYQLTSALESMRSKGIKFIPGKVSEWLDCGNKDATIHTNQRLLEFDRENNYTLPSTVKVIQSVIIQPCLIGENSVIENSVIGPHVTLGKNCSVRYSAIRNSLIQENVTICKSNIENSMLGNHTTVHGKTVELNLGDYSNSQ